MRLFHRRSRWVFVAKIDDGAAVDLRAHEVNVIRALALRLVAGGDPSGVPAAMSGGARSKASGRQASGASGAPTMPLARARMSARVKESRCERMW